MEDCKSKCMETGAIEDGRRLMVSQGNGENYKPGDIHKQCDKCLQKLLSEIPLEVKLAGWKDQLKKLKRNSQ